MSDSDAPVVVCDAGPLIHLDELKCLDLLSDFSHVLAPQSVIDEVQRYRPDLPSWFSPTIVAVAPPVDAKIIALTTLFTLHRGEREALQLVHRTANAWLLTDDTAARLAARELNVEAHGSIGIVLRAIRRGLRSRDEVIAILHSIPEQSTLFIRRSLLESIISEVVEMKDNR